MDSSDDDNDFNDDFFEDLRLHNTDSQQRKPQILCELPEVAQKFAVCELQPNSDGTAEIFPPVNGKQPFKEFLRDHKKECDEEIPCKIDLK